MTPDQINAILDNLQSRLEGPAHQVFEMTYRYVVTTSIIGLVAGLVLIIGIGVFLAWAWRNWRIDTKANEDDRYYDSVWEIVLVAGGIIGGFVALLGLLVVYVNLVNLLNPDYTTVIRLIDAVRPQ